MAETERKLPFALEAEQSVLGSILIDPEKFNDVTNIITADDFYLSEHAEIFSDRKSTRLNSSHYQQSRMPSSA